MAKIVLGIFLATSLILALWILNLGITISSLERYFFWWLLVVIIYTVWQFKIPPAKILKVGFYSFLIAALLLIVGFLSSAEFIMRTSLVFWLVGIFLAFLDLRRKSNT